MITQLHSEKIHYLPVSDSYRYVPDQIHPSAKAGWNQTYNVRCLIEENEKSQLLQYQISLELLAIKGATQQYSLTKSGFLLNGREPENAVDTINIATGKVLYPLQISVSATGGIHSILNYPQILERWPAIKEEQVKRYTGELMDWYLQSMEDTLRNREALEQALQQDLLLFTLLLPLHGSYGPAKKKQWQGIVPQLVNHHSLPCQLALQLTDTLTKEKRLQLELSASPLSLLSEARLQELVYQEDKASLPSTSPVLVRIQGQLLVDTNLYMLQEATLETRIQSSIYQQRIQLYLAAV